MIDLSSASLTELCAGAPLLQRAVAADGPSFLIVGRDNAAPGVMAALQREYALRSVMNEAWAAVPQALLPHGGGLLLVLADPGGMPLRCDAGWQKGWDAFVELAAGLATAVDAMHAAGFVHRALTPSRCLVNDDARVFLTGFGFAVHRDDAHAGPSVAELEWYDGSFNYMAPELGARMNLRVDARADLYSLGCILYQLLTGIPPFDAADVSARVHAHATHRPELPVEIVGGVPEQIVRMIMKLLEKSPDQRYADAAGLRADLQRCAELLRRHGEIPLFALDTHAALKRLQPIHGILGRDEELETLLALYRSVCRHGQARVAWISGHSGIGKSTLLYEALARMQQLDMPLLAVSKSEESRQGMPYEVLIQALQQLVQYVLGRPDEEFALWRKRIGTTAAPVGATLSALVPALAAVLDPQTDLGEALDASLASERERVLHALARVIGCFATGEQPLVLVLDDLQWADLGSLQALQRLLNHHADQAFLLLGAFRGNEVGPDHPLRVGKLVELPDTVSMELQPLNEDAMRELVARALHQDADTLRPLTEMIGQKTGRNPFFVHQLLGLLADDGLLAYDAHAGTWRWSIEQMAMQRGVDNVVDLLALKLEKLPVCTQFMLRVLACHGQRASTRSLAVSAGLTTHEAFQKLQPALEAGSVHCDGDDWVFWHDRIREASYATIPAAERAPLHSLIARRQLASSVAAMDPFEMAGQANLARPAIDDAGERLVFARLNLAAGQQAKAAAAHHSALEYFRNALEFLGEQATCEDGLIARKLCGEAEFLTGSMAAADARLSALDGVAGDGVFGADLARLRTALYTSLGRYDLALDAGLGFLRRLDIEIPSCPDDADIDREYGRLRDWLDQHGIAQLRGLPAVADPLRRGVVEVIAALLAPAMYRNQNLLDMILLRAINLAVQHGYSDAPASAYTLMHQIFGVRYGDHAATLEFGRLALELVDEGGLEHHRTRTYMCFGAFVVPWTLPARDARPYLRRAFDLALAAGDHVYALYCVSNEITGMLFAGEYLGDVRERGVHALTLAREANFSQIMRVFRSKWACVTRLQDGEVDPLEEPPQPVEGEPVTLVDVATWIYRLQAAFIFGDLDDALACHRHADAFAHFGRAFAQSGELPFYGALALLALPRRDPQQQAAAERHARQLEAWAHACPENFVARWELVRAEQARADGRTLDAIDAYARAVSHARRHGFTHIEALAAELAAKFYAARDDELTSDAHLRHARAAWQRWGAVAKARQLQAAHPAVFAAEDSAPVASRLHALDVQAVLRISNALAGDIVPKRLIEILLFTALESAGAGQGALALFRHGVWQLPARAQVVNGKITVMQQAVPFTSNVLPVSLVQAVARAQEGLVVDDPHHSPAYAQDPYIKRRRPRSVLCVPLMRYSTLVGVLYLENNLVAKVFTRAKAALLEVIASQAAFALENARLYEELVEQNQQRSRAEEQLRGALADLERATRLKAMGELVASIVHEVGQPLAAVDTSASAALRWLDRNPPEIGEAREMLSHIGRSATRANSIIQSLRAKARKAEPQFTDFDLSDALREAAMLVTAQLDALKVELGLFGVEQPVWICGDRIQLQQVVINLLTNGAESMAALDTDRRLWLGCRVQDALIQVSVDDTGSGIAPEIADRLHEPLFTTKETGMGMGLAISHSIVEAHGGTLTLSPRATGGTRAAFSLPLSVPGIE